MAARKGLENLMFILPDWTLSILFSFFPFGWDYGFADKIYHGL